MEIRTNCSKQLQYKIWVEMFKVFVQNIFLHLQSEYVLLIPKVEHVLKISYYVVLIQNCVTVVSKNDLYANLIFFIDLTPWKYIFLFHIIYKNFCFILIRKKYRFKGAADRFKLNQHLFVNVIYFIHFKQSNDIKSISIWYIKWHTDFMHCSMSWPSINRSSVILTWVKYPFYIFKVTPKKLYKYICYCYAYVCCRLTVTTVTKISNLNWFTGQKNIHERHYGSLMHVSTILSTHI